MAFPNCADCRVPGSLACVLRHPSKTSCTSSRSLNFSEDKSRIDEIGDDDWLVMMFRSSFTSTRPGIATSPRQGILPRNNTAMIPWHAQCCFVGTFSTRWPLPWLLVTATVLSILDLHLSRLWLPWRGLHLVMEPLGVLLPHERIPVEAQEHLEKHGERVAVTRAP